MPHLSPMLWIITIPLFLLSLAGLLSLIWWHQTPKFPPASPTNNASLSFTWPW